MKHSKIFLEYEMILRSFVDTPIRTYFACVLMKDPNEDSGKESALSEH
jgi:hypothetical protein